MLCSVKMAIIDYWRWGRDSNAGERGVSGKTQGVVIAILREAKQKRFSAG